VGDSFIVLLKSLKIDNNIKLYLHTTPNDYKKPISEIFSYNPKVTLEFVDTPIDNLTELTSDPHEQDIEFFPEFKTDIPKYTKYFILQTHSGKPEGYNSKKLSINSINSIIKNYSNMACILLGNDLKYKEINNCINLVGETSIKDIISLISNCVHFIGPEGFMSFLALSQKKQSTIFYTSEEAVNKRIRNTPWEKYSFLVRI
jgi:ADP-heptose:LPS heptosyltransferase